MDIFPTIGFWMQLPEIRRFPVLDRETKYLPTRKSPEASIADRTPRAGSVPPPGVTYAVCDHYKFVQADTVLIGEDAVKFLGTFVGARDPRVRWPRVL